MASSKKDSIFITFEGGEGAGKSTLIHRIEKKLIERGHNFLTTREPGGTVLGERIRKVLLFKEKDVHIGNMAELLLFLSGRVQHIEEVIKPALDRGEIVLCDRFNDSSVAYQGWARGLGMEAVQNLCDAISGEIVPDITFFLDVEPGVGLERVKSVKKEYAGAGGMDRIEDEKMEFHRKVREGFYKIAQKSPDRFIVIDANQNADEVFNTAWQYLERFLS